MDNEDLRNIAYLQSVFESFQKTAMQYYFNGENSQDRTQRAFEIKEAIRAIQSPVTIAATDPFNPSNYGCPIGSFCDGGVCRSGSGKTLWFDDNTWTPPDSIPTE